MSATRLEIFNLPKGKVRTRSPSPVGTCEYLRRVWRFLFA